MSVKIYANCNDINMLHYPELNRYKFTVSTKGDALFNTPLIVSSTDETARLRQQLDICKAALKPFADCVGYYRLNERKADAAITLTLCNSDFTAAQQALAQIRELEK